MVAATAAQKRAREYETIYVLRPDVDPDGAERVASRVAEVVQRENGRLVKVESWGRRKLAYTVAKQRRGVYYYLKYLGQGGLVSELERNLRMLDTVLKFQTVLLREDIEPETVVIDPEEIKFAPLEPPSEEDREESREKALGLIDAPEMERSRPADDFGEDLGDEEPSEDWVGGKRPARDEVVAEKKEEKPS
jgi:small subunit ribosomal protein S6